LRADGRSAYVLALRSGNSAMAAALRDRGADTKGITPVDELLGACVTADASKARAILAAHPGLIRALSKDDHGTLVQAVYGEGADSLRLMAELGFDLAAEGPWGGTPLHHAAWLGNAALVRLLVSLGAPVNVRDSRFGSSPIAWAAHGSTNNGNTANADYAAVAGLLLDAGSERAASLNRWKEPPESMASPEVEELLRARGFAP
jgi:ankyrin repeat protein